MVIGIIGASISGLIAGKLLAQAGHEVTIYEKSEQFGGRLATRFFGENNEFSVDFGAPYLEVATPAFRELAVELTEKGLLQPWGGDFRFYDGERMLDQNPNGITNPVVTSRKGMSAIGTWLARWSDIRLNSKVGGITYIGKNRTKKRAWMINLTSREVIGADAIIIALPAPQAYGILGSTVDETNALKIVREIDEIAYQKTYSLAAGYGNREIPDWQGIACNRSPVEGSGADVLISALPAPQAYGILGSTVDETNALKIVREIDEIAYQKTYSLAAGYGNREIPDWQGIACNRSPLEFISNEGLKKEGKQGCQFVMHSTDEFVQKHLHSTKDQIINEMLSAFAGIAGGWATSPEWVDLNQWNYKAPFKTVDRPFFELEEEDSPLALVGDYLKGSGAAYAVQSGRLLAEHWIERFRS